MAVVVNRGIRLAVLLVASCLGLGAVGCADRRAVPSLDDDAIDRYVSIANELRRDRHAARIAGEHPSRWHVRPVTEKALSGPGLVGLA